MPNINSNWVRWCHQSLVVHFDGNLNSNGEVYIEGRKRPKEETFPRYEVRIDGPMINQISYGCWFIDVEINVLILTMRDDKNVYTHQEKVGVAAAAFTDVITVKKYGDDPNVILGCFQEMTTKRFSEKVVITNFGLVEEPNKMLASTAEGHYQMCLKEV